MGKNNWQPIEVGMIEWRADGNADPANDLANVTLTLPTPPASAYHQQHQQPRVGSASNGGGYPQHPGRTIRPFPRRPSNRIISVTMGEYTPATAQSGSQTQAQTPHTGMPYFAQQQPPQTAPPMYGEDEVPMTVQLPSGHGHGHGHAGGIMSATTPQLQAPAQQPLMTMSSPANAPTPLAWDHQASLTPAPIASVTPVPMPPVLETSESQDELPRGIKRSRSDEDRANPNVEGGDGAGAIGEPETKANESDDEDGDGDNDSDYAA